MELPVKGSTQTKRLNSKGAPALGLERLSFCGEVLKAMSCERRSRRDAALDPTELPSTAGPVTPPSLSVESLAHCDLRSLRSLVRISRPADRAPRG